MFIGHLLCMRDHAKIFFVVSFNPPPHTHMADTIIIPTVLRKKDAKPLLWTLMWKKSLMFKFLPVYWHELNSHQLRRANLWIHSRVLLMSVSCLESSYPFFMSSEIYFKIFWYRLSSDDNRNLHSRGHQLTFEGYLSERTSSTHLKYHYLNLQREVLQLLKWRLEILFSVCGMR